MDDRDLEGLARDIRLHRQRFGDKITQQALHEALPNHPNLALQIYMRSFAPEIAACLLRLLTSSQRQTRDEAAKLLDRLPQQALSVGFLEVAKAPSHAASEALPAAKAPRRNRSSRSGISTRLRFFVLERDGFKCQYCGATGEGIRLQVDHRVSRADGGSDDPSNLVTACAACNHGKGAKSLVTAATAP